MSNASISLHKAQFHYSNAPAAAMEPLHNFTIDLIENQTWSPWPSEDYFGNILYGAVVPFLFGMVTLLGVLGNSLVIYVISTKQRMRTLTNLLLLNLAFADLSFVLICPPFTAYQFATSRWPFPGALGDAICKIMHYLLNVTAYVTIYTLLLIAAIRYMTIVHNAATVRYRTKRVTGFLIFGIWIVMLTLNLPILLVYGVQTNPYGFADCENYGRPIGQALYATFFVFAYLLPLTVILVLSISILAHINNRHRPSCPELEDTRTAVHKRQASRLLIAVVVIFAIFWLPVHIHLLIAYFGKLPESNFYRAISVLFNFLAYLNSCVNPIIYNCASKDFRDSFRDAMACSCFQQHTPTQESACLMTYHDNQNNRTSNGTRQTRLTVDSPGHSPPTARSVAL